MGHFSRTYRKALGVELLYFTLRLSFLYILYTGDKIFTKIMFFGCSLAENIFIDFVVPNEDAS